MSNRKPTNSRPSTVQQHFRETNDINQIMARHQKGPSRMLPPGNPAAVSQPRFANISSSSYHEMLNFVTDQRSRFMTLPSKIRRKFNHDPYQMFRWLEDPNNRTESIRLGLVIPTEDERDILVQEEANNRERAIMDAQEALGQTNLAPRSDPEANPRKAPEKGR